MAECRLCGRYVGLLKGRLSQHAYDLTVAAAFLKHAWATFGSGMSETASMLRFIESGETMADVMHGIAHGEIGTHLAPSVSELNAWRADANAAVRAFDLANPAFVDRYASQLSAEDRRVVRSMAGKYDAPLRETGHRGPGLSRGMGDTSRPREASVSAEGSTLTEFACPNCGRRQEVSSSAVESGLGYYFCPGCKTGWKLRNCLACKTLWHVDETLQAWRCVKCGKLQTL